MATLTPTFHTECEKVHHEHSVLLKKLAALDRALDRLECYSEVLANLATAKEVQIYGRLLADELPEHFQREEATLLSTVSRVSPELASFAQQMQREHGDLHKRLLKFCREAEQLETAEDLGKAIGQLKEQGKELTRDVARHVALEENELSGFL